MKIRGSVEDVVFRNAENGYSVVYLDCGQELVTAVGIFPPLGEGETLELEGEFKENNKFGNQFVAKQVKFIQPTSVDAIYKYLSSGLFKGIGESTAQNIIDEFGDKTLDIIEFDCAKLVKVKGVSMKKALAISETLKSLKQMQATILYLQQYEVGLNLAIKIYKAYESKTKNIITKNPYQLIDDVPGVGFITADKIALKLGFDSDCRFRISAAINYCLYNSGIKNGHTYLPKHLLCAEVSKLVGFDDEAFINKVYSVIDDNVVMGKVVVLTKDNQEIVMSNAAFLTEQSIAAKIVEMNNLGCEILTDIDRDISEFERVNNITLHEGQNEAIKNCINYGVNVITGGPGTGKTTIIKCIINILKEKKLVVCLCAPTGRAAKRLSEATGEQAKTIHRLLDLSFKEDGKGYFTYNENTMLDGDVIIVDEVSMCDEYVFNSLIKAIKKGGRLIMVGDKDQLPSVGAGNILADIIGCGKVKINYLSQIYRQSNDSQIITNAHLINQGKMPIFNNKSKDFFFDNQSESKIILQNTVDMVTKRLPKFANISPKDIQVLCPMKKGVAGVENVNNVLQDTLNPLVDRRNQITVGENNFRVGDKVIHTVNNYQMEWKNQQENLAGVGVFNGDIGEVVEVDIKIPSLTVLFEDGRQAVYRGSDFEQINLAYAISIHKAQGSEFEVALIAIAGGNYMIMTKNLLYTAVTRAKKMVVLVGSEESIKKMVSNNFTVKRFTMLSNFICEKS